MVAGQSHGTATQSAADQLSWQAHRDSHSQPLPGVPGWIDTLQQLDARMIYFAHDRCVWSRDVSFRDGRRHRHLTGSAAAPSRTGPSQSAAVKPRMETAVLASQAAGHSPRAEFWSGTRRVAACS